MKFKLGNSDNSTVENAQIPEQIVKEETQNIVTEEKTESSPVVLREAGEVVIDRIGEVQQRRTRDSQHFKNADGSNSAVFYSEPMFFLNDEGNYEAIDNTLESFNENGETRYKNKRNKFQVSFAAKTESTELLTMSQDGYKVSLSLTDAESRSITPDVVQTLRKSKRINRAVVPALHRKRGEDKGQSNREADILYLLLTRLAKRRRKNIIISMMLWFL